MPRPALQPRAELAAAERGPEPNRARRTALIHDGLALPAPVPAAGPERVRSPFDGLGLLGAAGGVIVAVMECLAIGRRGIGWRRGWPGTASAPLRLALALSRSGRLGGCASLLLVWALPCAAQKSVSLVDYPVKPIRIIVASSPGTASDFFARSIGEELGAFYGHRVIIENRAGAGGLIGNTM